MNSIFNYASDCPNEHYITDLLDLREQLAEIEKLLTASSAKKNFRYEFVEHYVDLTAADYVLSLQNKIIQMEGVKMFLNENQMFANGSLIEDLIELVLPSCQNMLKLLEEISSQQDSIVSVASRLTVNDNKNDDVNNNIVIINVNNDKSTDQVNNDSNKCIDVPSENEKSSFAINSSIKNSTYETVPAVQGKTSTDLKQTGLNGLKSEYETCDDDTKYFETTDNLLANFKVKPAEIVLDENVNDMKLTNENGLKLANKIDSYSDEIDSNLAKLDSNPAKIDSNLAKCDSGPKHKEDKFKSEEINEITTKRKPNTDDISTIEDMNSSLSFEIMTSKSINLANQLFSLHKIYMNNNNLDSSTSFTRKSKNYSEENEAKETNYTILDLNDSNLFSIPETVRNETEANFDWEFFSLDHIENKFNSDLLQPQSVNISDFSDERG
ncbi:hypothetical protein HELRODRAFT_163120 [Helobdella robusta]|uniref:Uncharacterized protein n=1 Tax=Helobdella robusta TaxID=6412 RepID=T1ETP2_HELRO|nr:hypothetical protein HELRODRAFT_163120 [Helobdella robusta]ESN96090.1 hypothetical protein HELRODRAFT_163120 [Helobdella robusta]